MAHRTTVFEREPLYAEVWKEPVSAVAKRYRISDVALRKICLKLGVPVPPLGYWAKVAAGQQPRVTKLPENHKGDTRYVRSYYEDPEEGERQARIEKLTVAHPHAQVTAPVLKASLDECHPAVRRTARSLKALAREGRGLLHSAGEDVFELSVSAANKERALLAIDAVLTSALAAGASLVKAAKSGGRMHLKLQDEHFRLQIGEPSERSERELTREEVKLKREGKLYYIPDRYKFTPTGKIKLQVFDPDGYSPLFTLSDGSTAPLERRLDDVVPMLFAKATELRVRREMREEEHKRWEAARLRREARERRQQKELERLKKTEEWVSNWRRAEDLRAFASALEQSTSEDAESNVRTASEVAWIRNAADWLDPLVEMTWPAVDAGGSDADDD
jgi:hypothetical protein